MDYPVSADENGVNLKPEKMEKEKTLSLYIQEQGIFDFQRFSRCLKLL